MEEEYGVPAYECTINKLKVKHDVTDPDAEMKFSFIEHERTAGKYYYGLSILTGKQEGAGTPSTGVYVTLVGNKGRSNKIYLQSVLNILKKQEIDHGTCDNVLIESSGDLGKILVVTLGIDTGLLDWIFPLGSPWFVSQVGVYNDQSKRSNVFPCQHWIGSGDSVSVTAHTTTLDDLPKDDDISRNILLTQRNHQLEKRKGQYQWRNWSEIGLPSGIDETHSNLPQDERFERVKFVDFSKDAIEGGAKIVLRSAFLKIEDLHNYERMATALGTPEVRVHNAARWTTDVEFGRQILNGVNPVVIEKCTKLPSNFSVTNEMVKGFLNRGLTLEQEMEAGNIYISDLKIMDGLQTREGQYCAAPICLLYVNGNNQLVPIAIQLKQQPGEDNPVFLPGDDWIDWLLAKIFYQSAHAQFHQLSTHYFSCHAAMEAYAMATMRSLPDPHPIFKLLRPHFRYTMAINSRARATLINDGGIIDRLFAIGGPGKNELVRRVSAVYSVHWTNIMRNIKQRGVDNADQLPGYYYRDDGVKIWKAIEKFVGEFIANFYQSEEKVKNDTELQSWVEEIHTAAFPGYFGAKDGHGFPKQISSREELTEYCTLIMFTGSAQHASINFGQYDMYGFVPNAPTSLRLPPPTKKGHADYVQLLQTLPNKHDTSKQIFVAYLLSRYSRDEIYLGNYPDNRFSEKTPHRLAVRFQRHLDSIAGDILQRNKKLYVPYVSMLPRRIPNSITI